MVDAENDSEHLQQVTLYHPNGSTYTTPRICLPTAWFINMNKALSFPTNTETKIAYMVRMCRWNYISPEIKNNLVDCYEYYVREDYENASITLFRLKRYCFEAIIFESGIFSEPDFRAQ